MNDAVLFEQISPSRSCDWAWQYAVRVAGQHRAPKGLSDLHPLIARVVQLLRAEAAGMSFRRLDQQYADIQAARRLWESRGPKELETQAWLLAKEPVESVAARVKLPADTVQAYESLFFAVTDRFQANGWINGHAIILRSYEPDQQHAVLLRRFAYYGGPHVLKVVMPELLHGFDPHVERPDLVTPGGCQRQRVRLLIQLLLMPNDAQTEINLATVLRARPRRAIRGNSLGVSSPQTASKCDSPAPSATPTREAQPDLQQDAAQPSRTRPARRKTG